MSLTVIIETDDVAHKSTKMGKSWKYEEMCALSGDLLFPDDSMNAGSTAEFWKVLDDKKKVIAWAFVKLSDIQYFQEHRSELEIKHVQVHPKTRRRGVGSMILETAKARAVADNLSAVVCHASHKNDVVRFYMKNGMSITKDIPQTGSLGSHLWMKWHSPAFAAPSAAQRAANYQRLLVLKKVANVRESMDCFHAVQAARGTA